MDSDAAALLVKIAELNGKVDTLTQLMRLEVGGVREAVSESKVDRGRIHQRLESLERKWAWLLGMGTTVSLALTAGEFYLNLVHAHIG